MTDRAASQRPFQMVEGGRGGRDSRPAALRRLLTQADLAFIMEAHSGLSAKIVEEAGFAGIWASGLSMSAMLGLRDNNEASWTQVLDMLEYMADATSLPILVDGDTGYGNFNNVRRLVRKLGERGIAGVCIEDKLFPKTNSFIGEAQPLADIEEFCGRIRAGKDAQTDDDFSIVARVEALISGHSMDEALRRAEAYHQAGADAILIHSKKAHAGEIIGFMERWGDRAPVVIVPTMYHATPADVFRKAGIAMVIWANHLIRSSITAMREAARQIRDSESLGAVEGRVASVHDIFALMGNDELEEASARYLPAVAPPRAIVLAASRGSELGALTAEQPKCMVDIRGRPLLRHLVDTLGSSGVRGVTVVRGYRAEAIALDGIATVDNPDYAVTGEAASLACALEALTQETVIVYGDVLFRRYILEGLLATKADIVLAVDASPERRAARLANPRDLVRADRAFSATYLDEAPARLLAIGLGDGADATGEWIGLMRVTARGAALVREELEAMGRDGSLAQADLAVLIDRLNAREPVAVHYITGNWLDVDTMTDLADARNFS
ncbi:phosphoenolpyruvate mutase [Zavarzinia sp. CC-PAN008]|uniref:phosphoenolpyruvate mutase n=1 Tax=Zavarzinia sp. CC-PAN008 TaxID=3243332 RepID=UPI003F7451C5